MTMGCTKEECLESQFEYGKGVCIRWRQEDYSTGGGLDGRRLCLLLHFLIFLELQGDLHSGNSLELSFRALYVRRSTLKFNSIYISPEQYICLKALDRAQSLDPLVQAQYKSVLLEDRELGCREASTLLYYTCMKHPTCSYSHQHIGLGYK